MERPEGMRAELSYSQQGTRRRGSESPPPTPKTLLPIMCTSLGFMRVTGLEQRAADVRVYRIIRQNKEKEGVLLPPVGNNQLLK